MTQIRIAYMTGEYLRPSPFYFIYREIAALRDAGVHIETISVRGLPGNEEVSSEQRIEQENTYVLLNPIRPVTILLTHLRLLFASPKRYLSTLALTFRVRPTGLVALIKQAGYFIEAGLVASRLHERNLTHLHNHFADSSCTVAMLAAEMGEFTFSFTIHGPGEFFEASRWKIDEKAKRALFICCISNFCRGQTMIWAPFTHWNRLHIVHCGIDPDVFTYKTHPESGQNLLFVGKLGAVKGLPILFRAIAELKDYLPKLKLTLIGDGPERNNLELLADQLEIRKQIHFLGFGGQAEIQRQLALTDVFVLPSFAEGVPVVLMEAMASGVPVVATQVGGLSELVEDGVTGYLVPSGNAGALAIRIKQLLDDAELRLRFGQASRAKVESDFNVRHEAAWLLKILTTALSGEQVPERQVFNAKTK